MRSYWFQDMLLAVQLELLRTACETNGRRCQGAIPVEETAEAVDDYFNRHNFRRTIPQWFQTAERFKT